MHAKKWWTSALTVCLLGGCGGGGAASDAGSGTVVAEYNYVVPPVGAVRTYAQTIVDNSSNNINQTYTETVTAVNSNGSFMVAQADPNNNSSTVNGTLYTIQAASITNDSSGQELSFLAAGSASACTFSPYGGGVSYPTAVGATWSVSYTENCGGTTPLAFQQTGSVVDLESVTVPAGTYSAGTNHTEVVTNWREANSGISVKEVIVYSYSGTAQVNGYPVSEANQLQSGIL